MTDYKLIFDVNIERTDNQKISEYNNSLSIEVKVSANTPGEAVKIFQESLQETINTKVVDSISSRLKEALEAMKEPDYKTQQVSFFPCYHDDKVLEVDDYFDKLQDEEYIEFLCNEGKYFDDLKKKEE